MRRLSLEESGSWGELGGEEVDHVFLKILAVVNLHGIGIVSLVRLYHGADLCSGDIVLRHYALRFFCTHEHADWDVFNRVQVVASSRATTFSPEIVAISLEEARRGVLSHLIISFERDTFYVFAHASFFEITHRRKT